MLEVIQDLLLTNNCVILPEFGAFIGNYSPAEIRLSDHKIFPPTKTIAFNRSLQSNDGLLINAVAESLSLTYKEAEEKVFAFSKQCNETLLNNKSLILKNLGRLETDDKEKIQFQPYLNKNYLLKSFGLQTLSLTPIQRLKDNAESVKEDYQRALHPELIHIDTPQRTSTIPYWIAAVLAIAFLTSTLTWNIHQSTLNQSYSSLLPVFEKNSKPVINKQIVATEAEVIEPITIIPKVKAPAITVPVASTPVASVGQPVNKAEPEIVQPQKISSKSYIVIGAFFDDVHANKVKAEAETMGYVVQMTTDYNNTLFRLSIEVESKDVNATLEKIKSDYNQRAWLYCSNCSLIK
ncbi:MAG: hypothetical protein JWN78_1024 [Bacteroidota bacterium]|nr:hypothetical protein [Bacteroidota bacterium]